MVAVAAPASPTSKTTTHTLAPVTANGTPASAEARHRQAMVEQHLPLVRHVAGQLARVTGPGSIVDYHDLVGYGVEGLITAIDTFDPERDVRFSTWAVLHIRTTILDALRALDPLPRSMRRRGREIERASQDLANRNGAQPTTREIAAEIGLPVDTVRSSMSVLQRSVVSLDRVNPSEDGDFSWSRCLADEDPEIDPEAVVDSRDLYVRLRAAVEALPEREAMIIRMYYHEGHSMHDIALRLGVSDSRVSQIHARALRMLRTTLTDADVDLAGSAA
jgi:RNA polymerase sigma factor for flagellar operon FliA